MSVACDEIKINLYNAAVVPIVSVCCFLSGEGSPMTSFDAETDFESMAISII